jgi:methylated-DNA-[protein]-cysteine S-methyltransferase
MSTALCTKTIATPVGPLELWASPTTLVGAHFPGWARPARLYTNRTETASTAILDAAERELHEYFHGERGAFEVPLALPAAPFFRQVLELLCRVPAGETTTYGDLARAAGRPTAARAVGMAMGRNPIAILVPCHRVVGSNGSLTGFAGGLASKRWLLEHERQLSSAKRERSISSATGFTLASASTKSSSAFAFA